MVPLTGPAGRPIVVWCRPRLPGHQARWKTGPPPFGKWALVKGSEQTVGRTNDGIQGTPESDEQEHGSRPVRMDDNPDLPGKRERADLRGDPKLSAPHSGLRPAVQFPP